MRSATRHPSAMRTLAALVLVATVGLRVPAASADVRITDVMDGVVLSSTPALLAQAPDVAVPSALLQTSDGETLWSRAADAERAMASTTKIMTAAVVLERVADTRERVTVPDAAVRVGEAGVGLEVGQRLTVEQLLEAMLVHSGNDAAVSLAIHVAGSEDAFVAMMNEKAAALGLTHTHFANVHGLDERGHYTSANDLATLAQYAMQNPTFKAAVARRSVSVPRVGAPRVTYPASNLLLDSFEGATGVKTGWTSDAGYCLVASAERNGLGLMVVVLGATADSGRFAEAEDLLTWGFEHYTVELIASADATAALVAVSDYLDVTVPAVVSRDATAAVFDLRGEVRLALDIADEVAAPVTAGQELGTVTVTQGDRMLAQVPVVAAQSVPEPGFGERIRVAVTRFWRRLFGGPLRAEPVNVL